MSMIGDTFNLGDVYFIDLWPLQEPFLIIKDHNAARKIMQEDAYPKHPLMKDLLHPVSGDSSIGTSEGQEWRMLRSVLSSSFSQNRLLPLVSEVLQEVLKFRDKMVGYTRTGETFSMLNDVTYLTFDVIGLRLLGSKLESQQEHHPLVYNFLMTKAWLPANTDVIRRNMVRIMTWWYSRKVDHWLRAFVKKRFEDLQTNETEGDCTLNILLQAFTDEKLESMSKTGAGSLDSQQMLIAVNNIKALLLAGHDTTASEFAYTLFLSKCIIWVNHYGIGRNNSTWENPAQFNPSCSWRVFEACFGQELAMMQMKMLLVVLLREFKFCDIYEMHGETGTSTRTLRWTVPETHGGQHYQVRSLQDVISAMLKSDPSLSTGYTICAVSQPRNAYDCPTRGEPRTKSALDQTERAGLGLGRSKDDRLRGSRTTGRTKLTYVKRAWDLVE